MTILAVVLLLPSVSAATATCTAAIATFETIITSDAGTGNLNKGVHRRIVAELAGVKASCTAGRDTEASRALAGEGKARVPVGALNAPQYLSPCCGGGRRA